ncbi:IclR family transcriptional regulator [Sinomonas sp. R1AF57]|uniref:IclR family transcriptional regulator n=2 Tax=Sinomonas TaxID=596707 RepID=UPI000B5DC9A3|nr:IclR family transcriptional regulator [Sinomonas sp. R1AF57]ASN51303.1 IclR family transcriptional regulator [Sinomonas sp. R1AF57]
MANSLEKALSILDLVSEDKPTCTPEEVAEVLGVSRTSSYRYLKVLSDAGLLAGRTGGDYGLGSRILELDRTMRLTDPLFLRAQTIMGELSARIGENLLLNSYYGRTMVCVAQSWVNAQATNYSRGQRLSLYRGAASKAILAYFPAHRLRAMYRRDAAEIERSGIGSTWDQFRRYLKQIRDAGSAWSDSEVDPGVTGIAAPIFDGDGPVLGSLAWAVPSSRAESKRADLTAEVIAAARAISSAEVPVP